MAELTPAERQFHHLMQADAGVRPALIEAWRRTDPILAERLAAMLAEALSPEAGEPPREERRAG